MTLLLFLGRDGGVARWLRLADGAVAERGQGLERPEPGERLVAIVPGEQVALHWLDLEPGLTPAQATGAARLMLAEASAQPAGELHVAAGAADAQGLRPAALVPAEAMSRWMAALAAEGLDPDHVVPETLLLAPPEDGFVRLDRGDGLASYRASGEAFAMEPDLADVVLAGREARPVGEDMLEEGLERRLSPPPLDLRQGPYARARRWEWQLDKARARRLALIGAAILLVTLAVQIASILRYTFAADAAEEEVAAIARAALPRAGALGDPVADLGSRLSELRGGGAGYGATAGAVFAALRATANVELSAMSFGGDGDMRLSVLADGPESVQALVGRIEAAGFAVAAGPPRGGGGRFTSDLTVQPR